MGLIYKPIGVLIGILGGIVGRKAFDFAWTKISDQEPPEATTQYASWRSIMAAAALQGMIWRTAKIAVDRWGAIGWHYVTGNWPGEKVPEPD
jgi:Protein of unknown function (DUF4235)